MGPKQIYPLPPATMSPMGPQAGISSTLVTMSPMGPDATILYLQQPWVLWGQRQLYLLPPATMSPMGPHTGISYTQQSWVLWGLNKICIWGHFTTQPNLILTPWHQQVLDRYRIIEIRECEGVVEMIKELSKGIYGFNEDELLEILAYISST